MKQTYIERNWSYQKLIEIDRINRIISEYERAGYVLTVRQIYYQLVARGHIENTLQSYKRTASLINDAKLSGDIDWDMIEDRTREFITRAHWSSPADIVNVCANQFHKDLWENQDTKVFVIIEKEALVGVLSKTCRDYDVPLLAARGYPSGSVLRSFAQEHLLANSHVERLLILHLGDHDPSGIDMTRDLYERIELFTEGWLPIEVKRIALNMDQIEEINPPENPAKNTDSRYASYRQQYGDSSWELDALSPQYINELVEGEIKDVIDQDQWDIVQDAIDEGKELLRDIAADLQNKEDDLL